jgi:predicted membrane protein
MRKYIVLSLLIAILLAPASMDARKKKDKKYNKKTVNVEKVTANVDQPMREITITNPSQQLYGEWDIMTMRKKKGLYHGAGLPIP